MVGCVSQVWVRPSLGEDGKVYFEADSDSQLTKGLAALLVEGLSGATPAQVLRIQPDFIQLLGLAQKLTASRNNGFLNMLLMMQKMTLALFMEQEKRRKTEESTIASSGGSPGVQSVGSSAGDAEVPGTSNGSKEGPSGSSSGGRTRAAPVHRVNGTDGRPIYTGMKEKVSSTALLGTGVQGLYAWGLPYVPMPGMLLALTVSTSPRLIGFPSLSAPQQQPHSKIDCTIKCACKSGGFEGWGCRTSDWHHWLCSWRRASLPSPFRLRTSPTSMLVTLVFTRGHRKRTSSELAKHVAQTAHWFVFLLFVESKRRGIWQP